MDKKELPVAVFDSGLGGLSVLRALRRLLPQEDFLYFGDSANAPYGSRPTHEVRSLTLQAFERLAREPGCKAMVVACNTATSAAIEELRRRWADRPVIGIEPALKPAVNHHPGGRVLVLATETTLREKKFAALLHACTARCEITPLPCPGLMEFVERGELDSPALRAYLTERLAVCPEPDAVVLGCTHYPFLLPVLRELLGDRPEILDGSDGTARETKRRLAAQNLLREGRDGSVTLQNSCADPVLHALAERLLALPID